MHFWLFVLTSICCILVLGLQTMEVASSQIISICRKKPTMAAPIFLSWQVYFKSRNGDLLIYLSAYISGSSHQCDMQFSLKTASSVYIFFILGSVWTAQVCDRFMLKFPQCKMSIIQVTRRENSTKSIPSPYRFSPSGMCTPGGISDRFRGYSWVFK